MVGGWWVDWEGFVEWRLEVLRSVGACGVGLIVGLCQLKVFLESELASVGIVNRWGVEVMGGHFLVIPR